MSDESKDWGVTRPHRNDGMLLATLREMTEEEAIACAHRLNRLGGTDVFQPVVLPRDIPGQHTSHFATCPQADEHRRPRQQQRGLFGEDK